jgi:hypothetical protein
MNKFTDFLIGCLTLILVAVIGMMFWKNLFPYDQKKHEIHEDNMKRAEIRAKYYSDKKEE